MAVTSTPRGSASTNELRALDHVMTENALRPSDIYAGAGALSSGTAFSGVSKRVSAHALDNINNGPTA